MQQKKNKFISEISKQVNLRLNLPSVKILIDIYLYCERQYLSEKQKFFNNQIFSLGCSIKTLQMFLFIFRVFHFQNL